MHRTGEAPRGQLKGRTGSKFNMPLHVTVTDRTRRVVLERDFFENDGVPLGTVPGAYTMCVAFRGDAEFGEESVCRCARRG